MAMLEGEQTLTLDLLNESTQAWVEQEHHRTGHTELKATPLARYLAGPSSVVALQVLLNAESPLLAGVVAHLFQPTLQDDIASTNRRLVQLGRDGIKGRWR